MRIIKVAALAGVSFLATSVLISHPDHQNGLGNLGVRYICLENRIRELSPSSQATLAASWRKLHKLKIAAENRMEELDKTSAENLPEVAAEARRTLNRFARQLAKVEESVRLLSER